MVPLKRRRPIREHFLQPSALKVLPHEVLRRIRQPYAVKSGIDHRINIVHRELAPVGA